MAHSKTRPHTAGSDRQKDAWHASSIEEVLEAQKTRKEGLLPEEVTARRKKWGPNTFTEEPPKSIFLRLYEQLKSPLTFVLVLAFLITFLLQEFVDAAVIAFALSIAVVVGILQEGRASKAFKKLSESQTHTATVIREGKQHVIPSSEVVVGDIVEVSAGTHVPADMRLLETKALEANEAALTGEWLGVSKHADTLAVGLSQSERKNMLFMGTSVTRGRGRGVVVAVGDHTEVGMLARDVQSVIEEKTPLQVEMERISRVMLTIIVVIVTLIFVIGVLRDVPLGTMLFTAIAIAVAAVPEGLPAAITVILAVAMEALLKRGGLVRNLLAAETLGSTTYVLTDKTGTLTQARMSVSSILMRDATYPAAENGVQDTAKPAEELLQVSLAATEAFIDQKEDGTHTFSGEPMERAILQGAEAAGIDSLDGSMRAKRIDHLAFNSENRFALGLTPLKGNTHRLCINGAPELLIQAANRVRTQKGVRKMTKADRSFFEDMMEAQTEQGFRIIGVSYKDIAEDDIPDDATQEYIEDSVFMGFLVFHDPVREGVKEAIKDVRRAGLRVVLVTGDNAKTALSIACEVGIAKKNDTALTGTDIEALDDDELMRAIQKTPVFSRILPHQKMRLATVLQKRGDIVAMTGDGVNDASALQKANIGVAVGSGTEVAKEAADLVLINDSFEIIRAAIEEGRRIISNLRKIVGYLISTSLSETVLIGAALVVGLPMPLTAPQILWANIIEEGLMSVAFAFEPGEKRAMQQKPRDIHKEGILSRTMLKFMAIVISVLSVLLVGLYWYLVAKGAELTEIRSTMFLAIAIDSLFVAFSFRSLTMPLWKIDMRSNLFFLGSFFISFTLLIIVLTVPFFQYLLSYEPVPYVNMLIVGAYGIATLIAIEFGKWLFFERQD